MLALELGHRELLLPDQLHISGHVGEHLRIPQAPYLRHARHHSVLFPGDMGEELAPIGDLIHGLGEGNGLPLPLASLAIAFQHLADAPGVVGTGVTRLTLGANACVHTGRAIKTLGHREVGVQRERRVGAAIDLHGHAVDHLHLDAATGVAVETRAIERVLGLGQLIEFLFTQLPGLGLGDQILGEGHLGRGEGAATGDGTEIHESTTGHAPLGCKGWGQLLSHGAPPDSCPRCSRRGAWSPSSP